MNIDCTKIFEKRGEMKKEFWLGWKNITKQEKAAIRSLIKAKKLILDNIPHKEVIVMYAKGSFPRREMKPWSDVDILVVVSSAKWFHKIKKLAKEHKSEFDIPVGFSVWCLWEFKTGKTLKIKGHAMGPRRNLIYLPSFKLIYGNPLKGKSKIKTNKEYLIDIIRVFENQFLPSYKAKKMGFQEIINQVFWLTDLEQRVKGKRPPHVWRELSSSIKDKEHIVHEALMHRNLQTKDKEKKIKFIWRLKRHLKKLKRVVK